MSDIAASERHGKGRVGYVLKVFPRVSETFVINEILALQAAATRLQTFSLHPAKEAVPHRVLREVRRPVHYVDAAEAPPDDRIREATRALRHHFHLSPEQRQAFLPRKYVSLAVRLADAARALHIRHLHAHFASRAGHVAALAAALNGCTYSITAHAKDIFHQDVDRELLRWKIANARFIVTVTDYNRRYLRELVADIPGGPEKIARVYNGIDLGRFHAVESNHRGEPPLFLGVGRLVEKKGFRVLVEACRALRDRGQAFRCEIIGGGPLREALQRQIDDAGLREHVRLRGVLATEAVAKRLRGARALVLPCVVGSDGNVDALPTVLLGAMATGLPVISTKLSGIPEIVDEGKTGFLTPPGDAEALSDAMAVFLEDADLSMAMGRAGRGRVERLFDLSTNAAKVRHLLYGGLPSEIV